MLIILAAMTREKPVAIAKNETREEKSRMVGKEIKSTLQHEPDPARLSLLFAIIRWPVPRRKAPLNVAIRGLQMANACTVKPGRFPQEPSRRDSALFRSVKGNPK